MMMKRMMDAAEQLMKEYINRGYTILYADTDGFYVENPKGKMLPFIEFKKDNEDLMMNRKEDVGINNQIECLKQREWDMCGKCEHYDGETGECNATEEEIREINKKQLEKKKSIFTDMGKL